MLTEEQCYTGRYVVPFILCYVFSILNLNTRETLNISYPFTSIFFLTGAISGEGSAYPFGALEFMSDFSFSEVRVAKYISIYSETCLNRTLSKPNTGLNQTDLTIHSMLCVLNTKSKYERNTKFTKYPYLK
jgi:hypothetical protein